MAVTAMFCAVLVYAGVPVKFDGDFMKDPNGKLARWIENKLEEFKPWGKYEIVEGSEGKNSLHLTAAGKEYHILSKDWFAVRDGQSVVVKASAKGHGSFSLGVIVYTEKQGFVYSHYNKEKENLLNKEKEFSFRIYPKDRNGKKVAFGRILIVTYKDSDVTISKMSAEVR